MTACVQLDSWVALKLKSIEAALGDNEAEAAAGLALEALREAAGLALAELRAAVKLTAAAGLTLAF